MPKKEVNDCDCGSCGALLKPVTVKHPWRPNLVKPVMGISVTYPWSFRDEYGLNFLVFSVTDKTGKTRDGYVCDVSVANMGWISWFSGCLSDFYGLICVDVESVLHSRLCTHGFALTAFPLTSLFVCILVILNSSGNFSRVPCIFAFYLLFIQEHHDHFLHRFGWARFSSGTRKILAPAMRR